ncbi:polyprenyl synthetase [Halobium palmae]|uniref:Polyprenyl synthetase n=1 Tax=Halobium palmae TaxID=1776492 RepID=A0ABD5RVD3_9EURY
MNDKHSIPPERIDAELERIANQAAEAGLAPVRQTLEAFDERWYGQLVVRVYESLANQPTTDTIVPGATAIELLRGYCRLRSELLVQLNDERPHSLSHDQSTALLAGDYLHSSAYSSLGSLDPLPAAACSDALTDTLMATAEAFVVGYRHRSSTMEPTRFFDDTTGNIGECAALLGGTIAGVDENQREHAVRIGRGISTSRQIGRILDADPSLFKVVPRFIDESKLREHADDCREDARVALRALSSTGDVTPLRRLVEDELPT